MRRPKRPTPRVNRLVLGGVLGCRACASPCGRPDVSAKKSLALCSVVRGGWHVISALESVVVGIVEEEGLYVGS
jgi:hypothetical protein